MEEEQLMQVLDSAREDAQEVMDGPRPGDVEWPDFVRKQFQDSEIAGDTIKVTGLRRVATKLLGTIIESYPTIIQAPRLTDKIGTKRNTQEKIRLLEVAVVQWHLRIEGHDGQVRYFGDVASCYAGNTDYDYAIHAVETAGTKAESRALRKALQIPELSTEEKSRPIEIDMVEEEDTPITLQQKTVLKMLAGRKFQQTLDVFFKERIQKDFPSIQSIDEIPSSTAKHYIQSLQE